MPPVTSAHTSQLWCPPDSHADLGWHWVLCAMVVRTLHSIFAACTCTIGFGYKYSRTKVVGLRAVHISLELCFALVAGCKCCVCTVTWSCNRCSRVGFSQMKLHSSVASFCLPRVTKLTDGCRARAARVLLVGCLRTPVRWLRTNLVDPASSHMLVSKIKPCMSQYKLLYGETANGSFKEL